MILELTIRIHFRRQNVYASSSDNQDGICISLFSWDLPSPGDIILDATLRTSVLLDL